MYRVTLDLWQDDCLLTRATADHKVTFTTPYWNFTPETGRWELWIEAAADDRDQLESVLQAHADAETMLRFDLKRKRAVQATVRAVVKETEAIDAITTHGGAVIGPFENRSGRERWHLGFTDASAGEAALASLDRQNDFDVVDSTTLHQSNTVGVYQHFDAAAAILDGCDRLTPTEWRVLRTAFDHSYYEIPRNETLASLGDRLDVSDVAISKTFRRAERKLLGAAVTALGEFDEPREARTGTEQR